ncbi:MAG: CueP family metal-binding protein [Deltaproteobacteria bacterium]|nr:CueP family metal-binding protein [Deltaproteobacteria bacterium]
MSSCQGELPQTTFNVKAVDTNGNAILDEPVSTLRNGFMELWLPRNRAIKLTIEGLGRSAIAVILTYDNSKTCITTMKLQ